MGIIKLTCIGLNRFVFIQGYDNTDNVCLNDDPLHSQFDWGYVGDKVHNLSKAILTYCNLSTKNYELFSKTILCILNPGNATVFVNIKEWVKAIEATEGLPTHPNSLVHVELSEGIVISKWLDFPYNGFKRAIFNTDTVEYQEWLKTPYKEDILAYIKESTKRLNKDQKEVTMQLHFDSNALNLLDGLGNGLSEGTKVNAVKLIEW